MRRDPKKASEWTSFQNAPFAPPTSDAIEKLRAIAKAQGIDFERDVAPRLYDHPGELFINNRYQVIKEHVGSFFHLSIRRLDNSSVRSWRDLQRIKNEIVGPENEAVELFPAESRLIDTVNQYHLWVVINPQYRFPWGFSAGPLIF